LSTNRKGSHGLRVLLEWVRTLDLHRTERDVMFVFAEHSNYWDGSGSRPGISTIAKKSKVSERHAKRIVANLAERGYLIQTERSRGTLPATFRLNVQLPISAVSTESTGDKSTDSLGVTSGDARGDISQQLGVTSGDARGDISMHAIRKTVKAPLSTTVKAPASAGAAADKNPWSKLVPGLQGKVLRQLEFMQEASVGSGIDLDGQPAEVRARIIRDRWIVACQRAGIWRNVAEQIADYFYIEAGGRIQPEHAPSAFRTPLKARSGKA
jgi:hypothetical protein